MIELEKGTGPPQLHLHCKEQSRFVNDNDRFYGLKTWSVRLRSLLDQVAKFLKGELESLTNKIS